VRLDLRLEADIAQALAAAVESFGDIDVLVNNAARALLKPAIEVTWAEWDDVVNTDLKGAYFMARTYAAHCIARERPGCVVNIASTHGMTGFAGRTVYGTAKGGLIQMTRMLAIEWIAQNIRVNAIAPGTALTPSRAAMYDDATRARRRRRFFGEPGRVVDHRTDAGRRRRADGDLILLGQAQPMVGAELRRRLRRGPSRR
jgi:NAD(P)-dependent dehydrogenase (short-subunit alcohol dehydrogenase family)